MVTVEQIQEKVLLAKSYYQELMVGYTNDYEDGCKNCSTCELTNIRRLCKRLLRRAADEILDEVTLDLYNCLLKAISAYSGSALAIDPNAYIPNTIIDVTIISDGKPSWFDFPWNEMESSDEVDGARFTYINPILDGWNPSLQTGDRLLERGKHYDMYEGGVLVLRPTQGIYDLQFLRADNFQPYDAPPMPANVGYALIKNQSTQGVTYNDNLDGIEVLPAGDSYEKNPIVDGQQMYIVIPLNRSLTYTRYNADNSIDYTITYTNTPVTSYTEDNMSITKRHEFIIFDNG